MSSLRDQMKQDLELGGYAAVTIKEYMHEIGRAHV